MLPTPARSSPPSSPKLGAVAAENHDIVYPPPSFPKLGAVEVENHDIVYPHPSSPKLGAVAAENHDIVYPPPPNNRGSAPFHVLATLFDKLQTERKPEKRRKLLDSWFNVCSHHHHTRVR